MPTYTLKFLQMIGCPHCIEYEKNEWPDILNSASLKALNIDVFSKPILHGPYSLFTSGDFRPLSPEYMECFFDGKIWGPAFILEINFNGKVEKIVKDKGSDISHKALVKWCKSLL